MRESKRSEACSARSHDENKDEKTTEPNGSLTRSAPLFERWPRPHPFFLLLPLIWNRPGTGPSFVIPLPPVSSTILGWWRRQTKCQSISSFGHSKFAGLARPLHQFHPCHLTFAAGAELKKSPEHHDDFHDITSPDAMLN